MEEEDNKEINSKKEEFKNQVNEYLKDVFSYEELDIVSKVWEAIDGLARSFEINEENKHLLPLAYACAYIILDNDSVDGVSENKSSISIGHISLSGEDLGSSLANKAYGLLEQYGFIVNDVLDVVNA